jgi:hypothetical protein
MELKEYIDGVKRTESSRNPLSDEVQKLGLSGRTYHGIVGVVTEINEVYDAIEFSKHNSSTLDTVNVCEEFGDALYYIGVILDELFTNEELNSLSLTQNSLVNDNLSDIDLLVSMVRHSSGDMLDKCKKTMFYGKPLDISEIKNTTVEVFENIKCAISLLNTNTEQVMTTNLAKLKARYAEKFTDSEAETRNLTTERQILEDRHTVTLNG